MECSVLGHTNNGLYRFSMWVSVSARLRSSQYLFILHFTPRWKLQLLSKSIQLVVVAHIPSSCYGVKESTSSYSTGKTSHLLALSNRSIACMLGSRPYYTTIGNSSRGTTTSDTERLQYVQIGDDCVHYTNVGEETIQRITFSYPLPRLFWLHIDCNIGMIFCHPVSSS